MGKLTNDHAKGWGEIHKSAVELHGLVHVVAQVAEKKYKLKNVKMSHRFSGGGLVSQVFRSAFLTKNILKNINSF